ncbi:MAG: hypothetical protein ACI814_004394 [Mariniblastus sp.]|jgi:hypothetical protein
MAAGASGPGKPGPLYVGVLQGRSLGSAVNKVTFAVKEVRFAPRPQA